MHGATTGNLSVHVTQQETPISDENGVFHMIGDHGDTWIMEEVSSFIVGVMEKLQRDE